MRPHPLGARRLYAGRDWRASSWRWRRCTCGAYGLLLAQVFWGLWLLPFGILVIRSGRFPRGLGWFLIVGCFGYVVASTQGVLAPGYGMLGQLAQAIGGLSELAIIVWLLARGAPPSRATTTQSVSI